MTAVTPRKRKVGIVISSAMQKTAKVMVERTVQDAFYKKYVRKQMAFLVHDEAGECKVGDRVEIRECRPISRLKRWRLERIVERA
ncbi:MAG: 30S ribosomal protein S17 [Deltaproteobacteria bacterium]|nr:30S ribosomal protein S17 [Deltaproteobacteria bacterium]